MNYLIRKTAELSGSEIGFILKLWNIPEWSGMSPSEFRDSFEHSEFHFLLGADDQIMALGRINLDFILTISGKPYRFAEIVGLVSAEEGKGYGRLLVQLLRENTEQRCLEAIGFCLRELRSFYRKCSVRIMENKAKNIMENNDSEWMPSEDDDILVFHLSEERKTVLEMLSHEQKAYLINKE